MTGSEDLGTSPELRALTSLLRCALRPDDPVAAVAYLRGDVCGLSDADLYAFKEAGGAFDGIASGAGEDAISALEEPLGERFRQAFEHIAEARERLTSTRPALAIEAIAADAGLVAGAVHPSSPEEASLRGGQMLRTLAYVRELAADGLHWGEITKELERVVSGDEDVDSMTLQAGRGEAVRVMNVHQAKGLEAPVVFLADPYSSGSGGGPDLHVRRGAGDVAIPLVKGEGHYQRVTHAPTAWHDESEGAFQAEEERHQTAEGHRLLYVAATRAKNMLVVSTYEPKEGEGYWGPLHAALEEADVPALAATEDAAVSLSHPPAPALDRHAARRERAIRQASAPSFRATTVTESKTSPRQGSGGRLFAAEGYGEDFGTAVHALFELLVRERAASLEDMPVEALLARYLEAPAAEEVERARQMASGLLTSDLWAEVMEAEHVHAEYPVATTSKATGVSAEESPLEIQRGTIDLLYGGEDGWAIIDFKTDRLAEGRDATALDEAHPYVQQVQAYADAWARVAGKRPSRQGLWLADTDAYVEA